NAIVALLFRDLLVLISLALLIAIPIAWYGGNEWLSTYPYRTELSVGIFVFIGLAVAAIGLGTISYQSLRTARMNPVDAIRRD
ncbi:MAG: ABC transporter permease, partial [Bacteroidota bacterium]